MSNNKNERGFYDVFVRTCAKYPSRVAMRVFEDGEYKCYTYSELYGVCEYIAQHLQQLNCNKGIIGLVSKTNIIVPCLVAAAHKSWTSFMFLDPSANPEILVEDMQFTVVMSISKDEENLPQALCKLPDRCLSVFGMCLCIYDYGQMDTPSSYNFSPEYSYIAMTSGTTGIPKKIQVPINCIQPNISDLTKIFNIQPDDIIYFSTPLTFDPSMVEILLACMNGASLLIAPPRPEVLFPDNKQNSVTIWQTTPSKFFQFSNTHIKNKILSKNSTLRILALGGEPLNGVKRLKELKHSENKTKIFTLYGVTEMSCWACVAELDLDRISDKEVPLGKCLSETKVEIEPESSSDQSGQIVLVSKTRNCIVLNKRGRKSELSSLKIVETGDYAEVGQSGTIYYRGRKDDIVKRFGHKINLQLIESTVMHCPRVKACSCLWLPRPRLLIVYYSSEALRSQDLSDFLKCKLDEKHWPDRIARVDTMPITPHGKVSKTILTEMAESVTMSSGPMSLQACRLKVLQEIKYFLGRNLTYDKIKDKNFFSLGGTSFTAVTICNNISFNCPDFGRHLLPLLLNESQTFESIIKSAFTKMNSSESVDILQPKNKKPKLYKKMSPDSASMESIHNKKEVLEVEFIEMWTYNTGKCVDATPALIQIQMNLYVIAGSHSGKVTIIDAMTSFVVGTIDLKARIEADVFCYEGDCSISPCGVVGAYSGTVVCFLIETGEELWRTKIGAMVKSKAVYSRGLVYIAAYDGNITVLDIKTGRVKQTLMIAEQAISANLVISNGQYIMVGTLSGVICGVHTENNNVAWRSVLDSPVFASPSLYDEQKYVLFAEVHGTIHCRTVQKGLKIWTFIGAQGNIFSSITVKQVGKLKHQLVFGCHDNYVYSIIVKNFQPVLQWKHLKTAPIYSTPCFLSDNMVLAASNDGKLTVLDGESGLAKAEYRLPGETFSSPAVFRDYLFIGCRNDLIYSLKYVVNN